MDTSATPQFYKVRKGHWWATGRYTRRAAHFTRSEHDAGRWKTLPGARKAAHQAEHATYLRRSLTKRPEYRAPQFEIVATYWNPYRQDVVEKVGAGKDIEQHEAEKIEHQAKLPPCSLCGSRQFSAAWMFDGLCVNCHMSGARI